jgi:hypothetical protein
MTYTREQIAKWFDAYFESVNRLQGSMETVPGLRKYFTDDFEMWMYTAVNRPVAAQNREGLLLSFVHPGLHEQLTPNYYVIDVASMVTVVQFSILFSDQESGQEWPVLEASAHYHLRPARDGGLVIGKIQYWTSRFTDEYRPMFELWWRTRDAELAKFGSRYLETSAVG